MFVFSCITIESLSNAGVLGNIDYQTEFSIKPYNTKKINKLNTSTIKNSVKSNLNYYLQTYSSRDNDCIGISDSAKVQLVETDLYYSQQVENLTLYTEPGNGTVTFEPG